MAVPQQKFKVGDKIRLTAQPSKVGVVLAEPRPRRGTLYYRVFFSNTNQGTLYPEDALALRTEVDSFTSAFQRGEFLDRVNFLQFLILEKIRRPLSDNLYTFYASRTDFQVYQFKPVLKFIQSTDRIILTELEARLRNLSRVLIVCPAALMRAASATGESRKACCTSPENAPGQIGFSYCKRPRVVGGTGTLVVYYEACPGSVCHLSQGRNHGNRRSGSWHRTILCGLPMPRMTCRGWSESESDSRMS